MIDMHCHLLHDVDDGVKSLEEAISQIKEGVYYGVTDYVLTPHYRPTKEFVETTESLQLVFEQLLYEVKDQNIDVNLFLGREIDEVKNLKELLANKTVSSMNDTSYLLLDFGVNKANIPEYIYEAKLLGYTVIVAHIERYKYIDTIESFNTIKKEGALIQINASSIVSPRNRRIKKKVKLLLKNKLVDFVATDAHRNPESYRQFHDAYQVVSKKYGKEYANEIFNENSKMLIAS